MHLRATAVLAAILSSAFCLPTASATWSIILIDKHSGEIAIGSATCLVNFDLKRGLPVVRPMIGAGAAQSVVDSTGKNRKIIWDELGKGTDPAEILKILAAQDPSHQSRQYGIADTRGRVLTFTGANCGAYANGRIGGAGTMVYAIQGNLLTGKPVLDAIEAAILSEPGGLPEKLMAGMEAARSMGGDGRCSCAPSNPTGCGSPPPTFTKSAHIAFMIDARRGDEEGTCTAQLGCANGAYYMVFNILAPNSSLPDPVFQLQALFDPWRASLIGVPDAVESLITVSPPSLLNDGRSKALMTIEVRDWQGSPAQGIDSIKVEHDPMGSAGSCAIGPVVPLGDGKYEVELTAGTIVGVDRLAVSIETGGKTIWLMPSGTLCVQNLKADLNKDGVVNQSDLGILLAAYGTSAGGDIDGDGDTDQADLGILLAMLGQGC